MTSKEAITASLIYFITPLIGLICYLKINSQMKKEKIAEAPTIALFVIFITYGGFLLVILTEVFWKWSALASIGAFYLALVAPIVMGAIAVYYRKKRMTSKYHCWTFISSASYLAIVLTAFLFRLRN